MALTVGTDTYISLTDANTYISSYYASTQQERISWTALSDSNKEAYLRQACQKIEEQILIGRKAVDSQTLQFPRAWKVPHFYRNSYYGSGIGRYNCDWYVQTEVPVEVKNAQVEETLSLIVGVSERIALQQEGVKSFSIGNLTETYDGTMRSTQTLQSKKARLLLKQYIATSVEIG
jgi:hypothetical protein